MITVNLRDYYPEIYSSDELVDVSADVAHILKRFHQRNRAHDKRVERHPEYSLDCDDGIENKAQRLPLSAEAEFEHQHTARQLRAAILALPPKRARRVYLHHIYGMKKVEIAQLERKHATSIGESISRSLAKLKNSLKKFE